MTVDYTRLRRTNIHSLILLILFLILPLFVVESSKHKMRILKMICNSNHWMWGSKVDIIHVTWQDSRCILFLNGHFQVKWGVYLWFWYLRSKQHLGKCRYSLIAYYEFFLDWNISILISHEWSIDGITIFTGDLSQQNVQQTLCTTKLCILIT